MLYSFPFQLECYSFFVEQYSGFLSIKDKATNKIYLCNTPPIHLDYNSWCLLCFKGLENPFTVEEMIDFHQWAITSAYIGIEDSPMNWELVQELANRRYC